MPSIAKLFKCFQKRFCRLLPMFGVHFLLQVGGRNSVLEQAVHRRIPFLTDIPTIVFGADVTHPQPGEDSSPSIAAVCCITSHL